MTDETTQSAVSRAVWHWRDEPDAAPTPAPVGGRVVRMLVIMAVAGAIAWWRDHRGVTYFLACFAAANVLAALLLPRLFHLHARLWEAIGHWGGLVIGTVLLTLAYYLFFTPVALVIRLLGRQPLALRFPGPPGSYWQDVEEREHKPEDYERQFG